MKKVTTIILALLFISTGCNQHPQEINKITEPNEQSANNLEQKTLCAGYESKALEQLDADFNSDDPIFADDISSTYLVKIFYSENVNSCLYIYTHSVWLESKRCKHFTLKDVLTREELIDEYSCEDSGGVVTSVNGKSYSKAYEDFSSQIIEFDPDFQGIDAWEL